MLKVTTCRICKYYSVWTWSMRERGRERERAHHHKKPKKLKSHKKKEKISNHWEVGMNKININKQHNQIYSIWQWYNVLYNRIRFTEWNWEMNHKTPTPCVYVCMYHMIVQLVPPSLSLPALRRLAPLWLCLHSWHWALDDVMLRCWRLLWLVDHCLKSAHHISRTSSSFFFLCKNPRRLVCLVVLASSAYWSSMVWYAWSCCFLSFDWIFWKLLLSLVAHSVLHAKCSNGTCLRPR